MASSSSQNWKKGNSFHWTIGNHINYFTIIWVIRAIFHTFNLVPACVTCFCLSQLYIPGVIIVACVPSNLPVFMTMCVLMGFSMATLFLLPWWVSPQLGHSVLSPFQSPCQISSVSNLNAAHMNHSHHLCPTDEYSSNNPFCWLVSSPYLNWHVVLTWDMATCVVSAADMMGYWMALQGVVGSLD